MKKGHMNLVLMTMDYAMQYMNTFNCRVSGNTQGRIKDGKKPIYVGVEGGTNGMGIKRPMYKGLFKNGAQTIMVV